MILMGAPPEPLILLKVEVQLCHHILTISVSRLKLLSYKIC